ncbi:o-succinylbenzoate synthase [Planococcus lenghuensis]|uniref:o-succinylbenzoate synthase n=1 Tax=Planococcus lenghuensis TaxID=2213202 RepID=A0A1Q2KWZ9_9BACL|nr:o-succinylbenzoate synthase [Planococcus lenghuensis]AQQ52745.1 o-succinylbenzoate synthase [Planococcus lenghuensis]
MELTLRKISVHEIRQPLKRPFKTYLQEVRERESLLVVVKDREGGVGYGECVAFSTPWYTEETVASCLFVLKEILMPLLEGKTFQHPRDVFPALSAVKGNRMAKAAIETAVWDLYAKRMNRPLWQLVGGTHPCISAGVVVATNDAGHLAKEVQRAAQAGYKRVKLKINRESDPEQLQHVISQYPHLLFFGDANGAFTAASYDKLCKLDACGFTLIEQPFGEQEWELHAKANEELKTAICLDESISSFEDAERMVQMKAGTVAVLKMGRLGGWHETLRVYEWFHASGIHMWVGGMIEFGVSKAHNLALASLPGIDLPGDFPASHHYWEQDIISPRIEVVQGEIQLSDESGIGYEVFI